MQYKQMQMPLNLQLMSKEIDELKRKNAPSPATTPRLVTSRSVSKRIPSELSVSCGLTFCMLMHVHVSCQNTTAWLPPWVDLIDIGEMYLRKPHWSTAVQSWWTVVRMHLWCLHEHYTWRLSTCYRYRSSHNQHVTAWLLDQLKKSSKLEQYSEFHTSNDTKFCCHYYSSCKHLCRSGVPLLRIQTPSIYGFASKSRKGSGSESEEQHKTALPKECGFKCFCMCIMLSQVKIINRAALP